MNAEAQVAEAIGELAFAFWTQVVEEVAREVGADVDAQADELLRRVLDEEELLDVFLSSRLRCTLARVRVTVAETADPREKLRALILDDVVMRRRCGGGA
jgi:hypothetical protein